MGVDPGGMGGGGIWDTSAYQSGVFNLVYLMNNSLVIVLHRAIWLRLIPVFKGEVQTIFISWP